MLNQRQWIITASLVASLLVGVAACATMPPLAEKTAQPTEAPLHRKANLQPYVGFAPFFIAQEEGYFAKYGIQVEFVDVPTAEALPLLMQGELDFGSTVIYTGLFNAIARGGTARLVMGQSQWKAGDCASTAIVARQDQLAKLRDVAVWKGLTLATDSAGAQGMQGYFTSQVLAGSGLTLADVNASKIPPASAVEALQSGSIALAVSVEPWITRIVQSGQGEILQSAAAVMPDSQYSAILFSERLLKSPELGRRVAQAYLDAVRQYQAGPTARNVEILAKYTQLDPALLKKMCWVTIPADGSLELDSLMAFQQWAFNQQLLDQIVAPDKFWEGQFIAQPSSGKK